MDSINVFVVSGTVVKCETRPAGQGKITTVQIEVNETGKFAKKYCVTVQTWKEQAFKVGSRVVATGKITSNEKDGKWYLNLTAQKIESAGVSQQQPQQQNNFADDDLPF